MASKLLLALIFSVVVVATANRGFVRFGHSSGFESRPGRDASSSGSSGAVASGKFFFSGGKSGGKETQVHGGIAAGPHQHASSPDQAPGVEGHHGKAAGAPKAHSPVADATPAFANSRSHFFLSKPKMEAHAPRPAQVGPHSHAEGPSPAEGKAGGKAGLPYHFSGKGGNTGGGRGKGHGRH